MIEDTIKNLTASIDALTAALYAARIPSCTTSETKAETPKTEKPAKAPKAPKAEEPAPKAEEPAPKAEEPAPETPKGATLEELRDWGQKVLDAGKTGVLVGIAKELGVKRISEVAPDKYAEVIERLKKEVANG